jgi:E3 ubiquitin-protein ligase HERC2
LIVPNLTHTHSFQHSGINFFRDLPNKEEEFGAIDMPFTTPGAAGQEVPLSSTYHRINLANRDQYVQSALDYRLHEFDFQVRLPSSNGLIF